MSPVRMSKLESAIRLVLEFNEAFNRQDVEGMMQLLSDDCVFESTNPAPNGMVYVGKEALSEFWKEFFTESPNAHNEVEEIFGFGERCILRFEYSWMDERSEKGHVRGVNLFRVRGGLINEILSDIKG